MGRERALVSPVSALILLLLRSEGALSSVQLARRLGLTTRQVLAYLHYFRRAGLVEKGSYVWMLTQAGREYTEKYGRHLQEIAQTFAQGINLSKVASSSIKSAKDIVEVIERQYDLGDCKGIVEFLVEFRLRTGRKYWWPGEGSHLEELSRELGISSSRAGWCLRKLEAQGIIYMAFDSRRQVVKVRLGRQFDRLFPQS